MGQLKPWTAAALSVLNDGEWHAREQLIAAGVKKVPPGLAYRRGEKSRLHSKTKIGTPAPAHRVRGDQNTAVSAGARQLVADNLAEAVSRGSLQRALIDGVDSIRLVHRNGDAQ